MIRSPRPMADEMEGAVGAAVALLESPARPRTVEELRPPLRCLDRRGSLGTRTLLLKGQMRYIKEIDAIVFLCSPLYVQFKSLRTRLQYRQFHLKYKKLVQSAIDGCLIGRSRIIHITETSELIIRQRCKRNIRRPRSFCRYIRGIGKHGKCSATMVNAAGWGGGSFTSSKISDKDQ